MFDDIARFVMRNSVFRSEHLAVIKRKRTFALGKNETRN